MAKQALPAMRNADLKGLCICMLAKFSWSPHGGNPPGKYIFDNEVALFSDLLLFSAFAGSHVIFNFVDLAKKKERDRETNEMKKKEGGWTSLFHNTCKYRLDQPACTRNERREGNI